MPRASLATTGLALGLALGVAVATGQTQQPAPTPAPSSGGSSTGGSTRVPAPSVGQQPADSTRQTTQYPGIQRPIFLSGRVLLDDGTPPPASTTILRVCSGSPRPVAYTDSGGRFSLDLSRSTNILPDASTDSLDGFEQMSAGASSLSRTIGGGRVTEQMMSRCELQASLVGYRSDSIDLSGRRFMDNPDVGTILLHRLAKVEGSTISAVSLAAPKGARKAYEKGIAASRKKKWDEAQTHLEQAVALYPQYADAWYELGVALQEQNHLEQARTAYAQAQNADSKFLKPYRQMAVIAVRERKWEEAAQTTDRLLRLDPVDFPDAYFLSAVARFNLGDLDAAEKSAREGMKLDPNHRMPRFEHLLGLILANKRDYAGAARLIRSYLQREPDGRDAGQIRSQLAEIDRLLGPPTAPTPPNP